MAKRSRRSARRLDDLPGLFDTIEINFSQDDIYTELIANERAKAAREAEQAKSGIEIDRAALKCPRILQYLSIGSGSSGNCTYVGIQGEGGVLIDAGIDVDRTMRTLKENAIDVKKISGILITHDHGDHVRYAYSMVRRNPHMHVYCTPRTLTGMLKRHSISSRIKDYHKAIFKEFEFKAGPFTATAFEVSHDGTDNVGFCLDMGGDRRFVVATDTGCITERADHYIRMANYLMIETNYDSGMLASGSYPEYLKARIASDHGHMDNAVTADYLAEIWEPTLTDIFLCHLSQDNNTPGTALMTVCDALRHRGITVGDASGSVEAQRCQVQVSVLPRFEASPLHMLRL